MGVWEYGNKIYNWFWITMTKEQIISILSEVKDPEIPVLSISDLGILRDVEIKDEKISVLITPTYSGCPAMEIIQDDIRTALAKHGLGNIEIKQVLSPAWTTEWMTSEGREKLQAYGIAAPATRNLFIEWRRQAGKLSSLPFQKYRNDQSFWFHSL